MNFYFYTTRTSGAIRVGVNLVKSDLLAKWLQPHRVVYWPDTGPAVECSSQFRIVSNFVLSTTILCFMT